MAYRQTCSQYWVEICDAEWYNRIMTLYRKANRKCIMGVKLFGHGALFSRKLDSNEIIE